jgi:hypothetical protein
MYRGYEAIKALKAQLKREKGQRRNIPDLLALADNNDPFYSGSPATRKQAEWFAQLWQQFSFASGVHLRRIHYRIVSVETPILKFDGTPYQNTVEDWGELSQAGKHARYLRLVDAHAFEDHRNPPPHLYMPHELFREGRGVQLTELGWCFRFALWQSGMPYWSSRKGGHDGAHSRVLSPLSKRPSH